VTRRRRGAAAAAAVVALLLAVTAPVSSAERVHVTWHPARPQPGGVTWVHVRGVADGAVVEGSLGPRSLFFFPYAGGQAAVVGVDLETKPGAVPWRLAVLEPGQAPQSLRGRLTIPRRDFHVQRLTLPKGMVDLDSVTERRAEAETARLTTLYRTATPERMWRGRFERPVAGHEPASGFGSRRIINGQPRAPHGGADYAASRGTPVVAANSGRVALVADFFFPGRLVAVDHGLGVYTLYMHLDSVAVADGEAVTRGQVLGAVGATGRATGPHLHFATVIGAARVDPAALLTLDLRE
jgi:murein DD-endopeptidase MepM/ murein hydrolase activator NlpD